MAVDEALLELAATDGVATLRFYEWSEPTLSLGYFQAAADRRGHPASLACRLVRRTSGGGAILHDRELTYSLAISTKHAWAASAERLYFATHEALSAALKTLGITSHLRECSETDRSQAFLCFQRCAAGDLLVCGHKIAGSAQRRHRGAILQHGSILLAASQFAPELPGLAELIGRQITVKSLSENHRGLSPLVESEEQKGTVPLSANGVRIGAKSLTELFQTTLCDRLNLKWEASIDCDAIEGPIETVISDKFTSSDWTFRR